MNVLIAHNFYGSTAPSGENQVVELEKALLQGRGHAVHLHARHSDDIRGRGLLGMVLGGLSTPWNPASALAVRRRASELAPTVLHVHNTFPLLSPAVFSAVGPSVARVLTLHNYRLFCPAAIPLRAGRPCLDCIDQATVIPSLRHGCYRGSRIATLPLAVSVALHRRAGTWLRHVDAFIALTSFQKDLMVRAGLPGERVWVKPNFYPGNPKVVPWGARNDRVVFVGRLSAEKGVDTLVDAWLAWGEDAPELRLVGDGPLRARLHSRVAKLRSRITLLGQVSPAEAAAEVATSRLLVLPSTWFEGFPMVIREAFAFGTPVAVSAIGPLPQIVDNGRTGVVFRPGDPNSLLTQVKATLDEKDRLRAMSQQARAEFEQRYSEDGNYGALMDIYEQAIAVRKGRTQG